MERLNEEFWYRWRPLTSRTFKNIVIGFWADRPGRVTTLQRLIYLLPFTRGFLKISIQNLDNGNDSMCKMEYQLIYPDVNETYFRSGRSIPRISIESIISEG
jgi:hypothetical protein